MVTALWIFLGFGLAVCLACLAGFAVLLLAVIRGFAAAAPITR